MSKYDVAFKLKVVQHFLSEGGGHKRLAKEYGIPEEKIRTWTSRYQFHGLNGLSPKRSSYSAQFKLDVLYRQEREQLSSRQVAAIYDIRNPNQVVVWRKAFEQGGFAALQNPNRRHSDMAEEQPPSSILPRHSEAQALSSVLSLQEENERLRAEVAYLKKLHALILERKSAALRKQRSSVG